MSKIQFSFSRPNFWIIGYVTLQPKFEANHMKNGKVTVLRVVEEEKEEEEVEIYQH